MHDAPWRHEHDRLGAAAVDLVMELDAISRDKSLFNRQFGTHDITSFAVSGFQHPNEITKTTNRLPDGKALLLHTEKVLVLRADEGAPSQRSDFVGRERTQAAELVFGAPYQFGEQFKPSHQT